MFGGALTLAWIICGTYFLGIYRVLARMICLHKIAIVNMILFTIFTKTFKEEQALNIPKLRPTHPLL